MLWKAAFLHDKNSDIPFYHVRNTLIPSHRERYWKQFLSKFERFCIPFLKDCDSTIIRDYNARVLYYIQPYFTYLWPICLVKGIFNCFSFILGISRANDISLSDNILAIALIFIYQHQLWQQKRRGEVNSGCHKGVRTHLCAKKRGCSPI